MEILTFLQYSFIQKAFFAGSFVAIVCSTLGLFLVLRKMSLIGDGLSHVSFGAIALGLFLGIYPFYVAIPVVMIASILILKISEKIKAYEDAAIGIISSLGIAGGVILASVSKGFNVDLFSYLFGNILTVTSVDLIIMLILDLVIIMVVFLFYKEFLALSFDDEFATVVGVPTVKLYFLLLCLIALTIVVLMKVVGIIMIIALLTIPAAISKQYTSNLKKMIFISILLSAIFGLGGLWLSYQLNLASGATIVIVSGIGFILSWFGKQGRILQV